MRNLVPMTGHSDTRCLASTGVPPALAPRWRSRFPVGLGLRSRRRRRHRPGRPERVPGTSPSGEQDRLPHLLGAPAVLRRVLSRGAHPVRHERPTEPALLRVDPRVDRRLPARLRRAGRTEPPVSAAVRVNGGETMRHLRAINQKAANAPRPRRPPWSTPSSSGSFPTTMHPAARRAPSLRGGSFDPRRTPAPTWGRGPRGGEESQSAPHSLLMTSSNAPSTVRALPLVSISVHSR